MRPWYGTIEKEVEEREGRSCGLFFTPQEVHVWILSKLTSLPITSETCSNFFFRFAIVADESREKFVQLKISFTLHQQFFSLFELNFFSCVSYRHRHNWWSTAFFVFAFSFYRRHLHITVNNHQFYKHSRIIAFKCILMWEHKRKMLGRVKEKWNFD